MSRPALSAALLAWLVPATALGHEVLRSVEPGRAWAVKLSYADGEVLAYVPFEVYSPGDPKIPYLKGRTDRSGYLAFVPDAPGAWRVKVIDDTGHGLDTTLEVGSTAPAAGSTPASAGFALRPVFGAAAILAVFAGLFLAYRRPWAQP